MIAPPEILRVAHRRNVCDGATDIPGGASLGHPRVFLEIDETGYVDCGYCDRRFVAGQALTASVSVRAEPVEIRRAARTVIGCRVRPPPAAGQGTRSGQASTGSGRTEGDAGTT